MSANHNSLIAERWPEARKRHLFPELPTPVVVAEADSASAMSMRDRRMTLNGVVIEALSEQMPAETVVDALLDHAVAHHTYCPWDFQTHLALYAELKPTLLDGELTKRVVDAFVDVVTDTHCVRDRGSKIPELYRNLKVDGYRETIRSLYQSIWGADLGAAEPDDTVDRLARIPYLDRKRWMEAIRSFSAVMAPLIQAEMSGDDGPGEDDGGMMGPHSLQQYSDVEIEEGLKQFSERGFHAFREMVRDFEEELSDVGQMPEVGAGKGRGNPTEADLLYYMNRARQTRLPIRETPLEKSGGTHPHSHAPWEVGKPVSDIDVWTSFGKVLPGISQVWQRREGETHATEGGTPDCVVAIDSSGSMDNPCETMSHAVLGAACAADAYLNRDRRVAVYNFSDAPSGGREILPFTRNRKEIYGCLCRYFGGGTALRLEDFESLVDRQCDLFLITDMQISNLEAVIAYLTRVRCRVTAVHVGRGQEVSRFRDAVSDSNHVCVYGVEKAEDIPGIVLAEVEARFSASTV